MGTGGLGVALNTLRVQVVALPVFLDQSLALDSLVKILLARERLTPVRINRFLTWYLTLM